MKRTTYPIALSIAGSDSSGGAGIQADIKTMSALGVYAATAITAITAQNTLGVASVEGVSPRMVKAQIDAVFADLHPRAVKIGMLFSAKNVAAVADALAPHADVPIVLDPVMISTSGCALISDEAIALIKERLMPMCAIITPNVAEAKALTDTPDPDTQIIRLRRDGAKGILLKGGDSDGDMAIDIFSPCAGAESVRLSSPRVATPNTHGTGCTLSSAIASYLARGFAMGEAVASAKAYIDGALSAGAEVSIGGGHGPLNHLYQPVPLITVDEKI